MARKTTGKRSVGHNGAVQVHGKASNGEGCWARPTMMRSRRQEV